MLLHFITITLVVITALVVSSFFPLSSFPFIIIVAEAAKLTTKEDQNLYTILGVSNTATTQQIKSAYRRKARDTHPDKNRNVSAEHAAIEFQKVVHAFEILSDVASRRRYDVRGDERDSSRSSSSSSSFHYSFFQQQQQQQRRRSQIQLKDKLEVQQAQSRVLHIVSLDQLRTIMLDENDVLERHLLLCFYTPTIEGIVTNDIVYPYPFAGMSPQSIWWEDLLQTASIRFHRSNDLTRYFGTLLGQMTINEDMKEPVFLFLKKGTKLNDGESFIDTTDVDSNNNNHAARMHITKDRASFEKWMWTMIEVQVTFHNQHFHPVEIYWISGNRANIKTTIEPNETWVHYSMLTHEFYSRDARVDLWEGSPGRFKLTTNSSLGSWKIGVSSSNSEKKDDDGGGQQEEEHATTIREDGSVYITIPPKQCLDLSGHCTFWANQNQCTENPTFMAEKCMLTCGHCSNDIVQEDEEERKEEATCKES